MNQKTDSLKITHTRFQQHPVEQCTRRDKNTDTVDEARRHINNACFDQFFEEIEKVVRAPDYAMFNQLRYEFIDKGADKVFVDRLKVFTQVVKSKIHLTL